ncbi:glucose-6-phosphate isomerase family protein [Clostridium vincentii]|uniref:glucose-6-phosphate isomerase n=1 Tax=Clostridium vincentii TaxID=52704 RepID=A0A2T0BI91_9CLOT|nr:glucose-6-phosphate isomerase family protein [Clostridium vincentii]PRR83605.1 glucose-6-phosphate isomerase [Clostridium vincentii]
MEIREPKYTHDFFNGVINGENVESYKKTYKDISFAYADVDKGLALDTEMYEVYFFNCGGENTLLWGLTILHPITVNEECNLTRGHFHLDRTEPELYFGLGGQGLLMYMDEDGNSFCEKVFKGSVHYIHGNYAHRLINTGDIDFKVGACWRDVAGHDYKAIENKPFPKRVYKINNETIFRD